MTTSPPPLFTVSAPADETAKKDTAAMDPKRTADKITFYIFIRHLSIIFLKLKEQKQRNRKAEYFAVYFKIPVEPYYILNDRLLFRQE